MFEYMIVPAAGRVRSVGAGRSRREPVRNPPATWAAGSPSGPPPSPPSGPLRQPAAATRLQPPAPERPAPRRGGSRRWVRIPARSIWVEAGPVQGRTANYFRAGRHRTDPDPAPPREWGTLPPRAAASLGLRSRAVSGSAAMAIPPVPRGSMSGGRRRRWLPGWRRRDCHRRKAAPTAQADRARRPRGWPESPTVPGFLRSRGAPASRQRGKRRVLIPIPSQGRTEDRC